MSKETYALALKNALTEIRNVCPDVQTSFLFDRESKLVAGDDETSETTVDRVVSSLEGILEKGDTIGGLNSIVIEGSKGNVHISSINDMYLTMISSKNVDMQYLETVTRVLIPTVIKLLDNIGPAPLKYPSPSHTLPEPEEEEELSKEIEEEEENEVDEAEELELPSNQLIVESFGGLLVRSDTVQISEEIVSQWQDALNGKGIDFVQVESFNGKASECKVKTLDGSKLENKAIIRIPEKLCQTLDIKKGELVRVKPVIS